MNREKNQTQMRHPTFPRGFLTPPRGAAELCAATQFGDHTGGEEEAEGAG